ncbi:MAG: hypothetical protein RLZZ28_806 [Bacteroidota bacterium]|jgi:hypothetical protein
MQHIDWPVFESGNIAPISSQNNCFISAVNTQTMSPLPYFYLNICFVESIQPYLILFVVILVGLVGYFMMRKPEKTVSPPPDASLSNAIPLQLQAYERMALLVDRMAIPNLISRTSHEGLLAREMQMRLTKSIRDEFDYNITQQIYIDSATWNAIKTLKEKNLLLINQVAAGLAPTATGFELNKAILEKLLNDPQGNMHELVSEAISIEAKKLFKS